MLKSKDLQLDKEEFIRIQMTSKIIPTMRRDVLMEVFNKNRARTTDLLSKIVDQRNVVFQHPLEAEKEVELENEVDRLLKLCSETRDCMYYSLYIINNIETPDKDLEDYRDAIYTVFEEMSMITSQANARIA